MPGVLSRNETLSLSVTSSVQPRLAAIDIGSNSIRLMVAEVEDDGNYRVLDEEREMARLGEGMTKTGRIGDRQMERGLGVIGKMKAIADGFRADLRAIATSAVREASNGREFCLEVARRHKVRLEVISAEEEASLAFRSAERNFSLDGRQTAIVDIGGGSMEVVFTAGTLVNQLHSLLLGTVRLTEELCKSDPLRPRHWQRLREEIDKVIKRDIGKVPFTAETMIGSGGTFTALAQISRWEREGQPGSVHGYVLRRAELTHILHRLLESPLEKRRHIPGLNPKRADIIVAGAAAVARLAKWLGTQQILINDRGVRDGIMLSMIEERMGRQGTPPSAVRERIEWVRVFARKCRSNEWHCEHVAKLALQMFDGLEDAFKLPPAGREILHAAALVHDIGYLIHHSRHHKHTYHLILNSGIPGFSARELEMIANVARYHRRARPKKSHSNLKRMEPSQRRLIGLLSGILRVADGLDRTHSQSVKDVSTRVEKGKVRLVLHAHAAPQVEIWDARRKSDLFAKAFHSKLEVAWQGTVRKPRPARPSRRRAAVGPRTLAPAALAAPRKVASLAPRRPLSARGSRSGTPAPPSPHGRREAPARTGPRREHPAKAIRPRR